ncbi:hypothetical protein ACP4OV_007822 [Aristida adscensionis]
MPSLLLDNGKMGNFKASVKGNLGKRMDFRGILDMVASLFNMGTQKTYILFRVEFLVVVVTILFISMFIMDVFRRHFHSSIMKAAFRLFDGVSDSIIVYLLGAMKAAPFKNELFPVWGLVLVICRYSVGFISGYGVPDPGGQRFTVFKNVMILLVTSILNWKHGSRFALPMWSLLGLQMLRTLYTYISHAVAMNSAWHGRSSKLISKYMRADRDRGNWIPEECSPWTMDGYKYLVYGERIRSGDVPGPNNTVTRSSVVTLDKIWRCHRHLLCDYDTQLGQDLKDLSLAFALSRLLRARFEEETLGRNFHRINRKLVKARIVEERDVNRAFGIMELHLAFVDDYFNSRYPMVFWSGLGSLFFSLLQSFATIGVVCWLSVDISKVCKPPDGEFDRVVKGFNVDVIITWAFILLLVCKYASGHDEQQYIWNNRCMERLISGFFRAKIKAKRWHGRLDQYIFLQSYDDRPKFCNFIHMVTTGLMFPKKEDGAKLSSAINVPEYVRHAVLEKLHALLNQDGPRSHDQAEPSADAHRNSEAVDSDGSRLPKVITTLLHGAGDRMERYGWACFDLQTSSQIILVWHIATSICEMAFAKKQGIDLSEHGFLRSMVSIFSSCCSSTSRSEEHNLSDELRRRYIIGNSLSRYCTYLLVSKPDMIPNRESVAMTVFQETVRSARDKILAGCDSLERRYSELMLEAERASQDPSVKTGDNVVKQGAVLAKDLLDHEGEEGCWDILAGIWTELLVHIAPTQNALEHKTSLESGGEFITHIWALLWHCGIEKSSFWPQGDAAEDEAVAAPQDNDAGNNNNINTLEEETQQAAEVGSDHQTQIITHRDNEIEEL